MTSGLPIVFSAWYKTEPNNSGNGEDCLVIRNKGHKKAEVGKWNDQKCNGNNKIICQKFA